MKLNDLKINQKAVIISIDTKANAAKRLIEIGFSVGTEVIKIINGMSTGLCAYEVKNTVVALRNETAESVNVLTIKGGYDGK